MSDFSRKLKNRWQMVLIITVLVGAIVFTVSAVMTPRFSSDLSVLVIQKQSSSKVDAFSAAKSAEYLSDILSRVIFSEAFMEDVLSFPGGVGKEFSSDPEERKEQWKDALDVRTVNNTGIIKITVLDESRENAEKMANAISWAMTVRGIKYHGGGERVQVMTIDGPITSAKPAQPNILMNTVLGLIIGFLIALVVVFFFDDMDLRVVDGKKKKELSDVETEKEEKVAPVAATAATLGTIEKIEPKKREASGETSVERKIQQELEEKKPEDLSELKEDHYTILDSVEKEEEKEEKKEVPEFKEPTEIPEIESSPVESVTPVKKSDAPENLPIFDEKKAEEPKEEKVEKSSPSEVAHGYAPEKKEEPKEASEEEVKERLNRLLKGDL